MKKILFSTLAAALCFGSIHARTWTSSDGSKTFAAKYVSHTDEYVTVDKGLKRVRFKISLLSEDDRKWLEEQKKDKEEASEPEPANLGKIGEKLNKSLTKFDGKKYSKYKLEKAPEYYLLYFSASW